jgi:hypothetical protein
MVSNMEILEVEIVKELIRLRRHINEREFFDIVSYLLCVMEGMTEYLSIKGRGGMERSVSSLSRSLKKSK